MRREIKLTRAYSDSVGGAFWYGEFSDSDAGPIMTPFPAKMSALDILDRIQKLNPEYEVYVPVEWLF